MMGQLVEAGEAPDPQMIADAVIKLVDMPAGNRPLRTVLILCSEKRLTCSMKRLMKYNNSH